MQGFLWWKEAVPFLQTVHFDIFCFFTLWATWKSPHLLCLPASLAPSQVACFLFIRCCTASSLYSGVKIFLLSPIKSKYVFYLRDQLYSCKNAIYRKMIVQARKKTSLWLIRLNCWKRCRRMRRRSDKRACIQHFLKFCRFCHLIH